MSRSGAPPSWAPLSPLEERSEEPGASVWSVGRLDGSSVRKVFLGAVLRDTGAVAAPRGTCGAEAGVNRAE